MKTASRSRSVAALVDSKLKTTLGLSLTGGTSILAVCAVLITVSMPRLRSFARSENEADARETVALLVQELGQTILTEGLPSVGDLSRADPVARALTDSDYLGDGHLLRRHGYLFSVLRLEAGIPPEFQYEEGSVLAGELPSPAGGLAIIAWPWRHGRTGADAFLAIPGGDLYRHRNKAQRWNGPLMEQAVLESWEGWEAVHGLP